MEKGIKSKCIHVSELLLSESTHMTTEQETALPVLRSPLLIPPLLQRSPPTAPKKPHRLRTHLDLQHGGYFPQFWTYQWNYRVGHLWFLASVVRLYLRYLFMWLHSAEFHSCPLLNGILESERATLPMHVLHMFGSAVHQVAAHYHT